MSKTDNFDIVLEKSAFIHMPTYTQVPMYMAVCI